MRIWDYRLLPYLPDIQLKWQWIECVRITYNFSEKDRGNDEIVNMISKYPPEHFATYCFSVFMEMKKRGFSVSDISTKKIGDFGKFPIKDPIFDGWHNSEYINSCMNDLYKKHRFGFQNYCITDKEWEVLLDGYKTITGEEYKIQ